MSVNMSNSECNQKLVTMPGPARYGMHRDPCDKPGRRGCAVVERHPPPVSSNIVYFVGQDDNSFKVS